MPYAQKAEKADSRYRQSMDGGMRTVYPRDLNKGLSSELLESYRNRQTAPEVVIIATQMLVGCNTYKYSFSQCVENNKNNNTFQVD